MKELAKLLEKKKKEQKAPMDEVHKEAKMSMLKSLKDEMGGTMGDDIRGMKKVTVASPDEQGLKKGLDKAKDLVGELDPEETGVDDAHSVMGNVADLEKQKAANPEEQDEEMSKEEMLSMMDHLKKKLEKLA